MAMNHQQSSKEPLQLHSHHPLIQPHLKPNSAEENPAATIVIVPSSIYTALSILVQPGMKVFEPVSSAWLDLEFLKIK